MTKIIDPQAGQEAFKAKLHEERVARALRSARTALRIPRNGIVIDLRVPVESALRQLLAVAEELLEWRPIDTAPSEPDWFQIWDEWAATLDVARRETLAANCWFNRGGHAVSPTHWRPLGPGPEVTP